MGHKTEITVHLNKKVLTKLADVVPKQKRSAYIDEVVSKKFGISYEEAFPNLDKCCKRKWVGAFEMDIPPSIPHGSFKFQVNRVNSEKKSEVAKQVKDMFTGPYISPKKIEELLGNKTRHTKEAITVSLNNVVLGKINELVPRNKRSAYIDMVLSEHFDISYEEAYPTSWIRSYGEKRKWDVNSEYRQMDIDDPGRFSEKRRREKAKLVINWRRIING